jgi:DNA polymerase elongation subunit (family B)
VKHTIRQVKYLKSLRPELQYTSIATIGNRVFARARANDGAPVFVETEYCPTYFTPDLTGAYGAVGFDGTALMPNVCDTINDGRRFLEEQEEHGVPVYGNIQPEYMVLSDVYGDKDIDPNMDRLLVWFLDIEVDRDPIKGFAKIDDPFNPVTAITVIWQHMGQTGTVIYGTKDYTPKDAETYVQCKNEDELLRRFLDDFSAGYDYPDIVTGWNVQFYDIPYLINRMKLLFAEENWMRFSPFERIQDRRVTLNGRDQTVMDVKGIAILDYYELYRKFTYQQQESYRLDHIAHVELGKRKLSYAEFRSLYRLYRENHQKFITYNANDVKLVVELDAKMKLIELVCALAYGSKANFADTFHQVRLWDIMAYHYLRAQGKQIPPRKNETKTEQYAGAYVKDPLVGLHNWVVSFDVASMYPGIIREWNLSPETIIDRSCVNKWTVDDFLTKSVDTTPYSGTCLAGNGLRTRSDVEGFIPHMLKTLYEERIRFKGLMNQEKNTLELVKAEKRRRGLE